MADPKVEEILAPLRASVKEQVSKPIFIDTMSLTVFHLFRVIWYVN